MKTLYILRHAKSDRSQTHLDDFDRGLSERGKADLQGFPEQVASEMEEVEYIIASSSKRTAQTADRRAKALDYDLDEIEYTRALYMASKEEILEVVTEIDDNVDTLLYVGHNSGITNFINRCGHDIEKLPTSGIVCFDFSGDSRADLDYGLMDFKWFKSPKK